MKKAFYDSNSSNVVLQKAVISGSGHVIGKNYSRDELRDGDVGLEMRIDRAKLKEMTPEQRNAAQDVGREMCDGFLNALGVETETEGFKKGMLVSVCCPPSEEKATGLIERITENALLLRTYIDADFIKTRLMHIPLNRFVMYQEEAKLPGMDGILMHVIDHENWDIGPRAIARITDQAVLEEIKNTHKDYGVREAAVHRLRDLAKADSV